MAKFQVQFDMKGSIVVEAVSYREAERLAKRKLEQYKESMGLHFQKEVELGIDDIEEVS